MWNDKDSLTEYLHASECRRFELYLQFPKLRFLFDEIESSLGFYQCRGLRTLGERMNDNKRL